MSRIWRREQGSLTIEAAVVLPVFLGFILALINFTRVAAVYLAMDHAVSETVKQMAAYAYPIKHLDSVISRAAAGAQTAAASPTTAAPAAGTTVQPDLVGELQAQLFHSGAETITGVVLDAAGEKVARQGIKYYYPLGRLDDSSFSITRIKMYHPGGLEPAKDCDLPLERKDVALVVTYQVKIAVPFFAPVVTLSNAAVERAWVDD